MATDIDIESRRAKASELLSVTGFMALAELVQELGVSESTVRRDLEVLEEQGVIRRTHGGAVYVQDNAVHRLAFSEREGTAAAEKRAVGQAVAGLVPDGQTLILSGGTTCIEVARALMGRRLYVVTNSVPIASLLSVELATEITLIGGYVYPRTGVALGAMAEQSLSMLHATQVVMGCAGITREGVFNANQMMVETDRKMIEIADQAILAVDHSKFARRSVVRMGGLDMFDVIVTDSRCDDETRRWLEDSPVKVVYADVAGDG